MQRHPATRLRTALLALALLATAPALAAQGRIVLLDKQRKPVAQADVTVLAETLDTVRFAARSGGETTRKTADVVEIDYGPGSESFQQGVRARASGDLSAAEGFFAAASRDSSPPWVAAQALLAQAQAAAARGAAGLPAALGALEEFRRRFPEHRLLPQALLDEARLSGAAGDEPRSRTARAALLALAKDGKVTPDWIARARLQEGDALLAAGDARQAARAFAEAESAAKERPAERPDLAAVMEPLMRAARLGTGSCLLAAGDLPAARAFWEQLARDGRDDPVTRAAAANGIAECDFREPGKLKQAQLGFARVALTAAAVPEERAHALYYLGCCAQELGKAGREPDAARRAADCFREVVARYPDSRWAVRARESLP
ncbi:MAG TPA: hypothetical protein VK824_06675 [Planctomycetota bacterium]|nr:hypothetical protein [Planctomycetota bacterium]